MTPQAEPKVVSLESLADGAAEELFQAALRKVLENIDDPNTDHKARRRISLTVDFVPNEERRAALINVACVTKLAGIRPVGSTIFIGMHEGRLAAVEAYRQEDLFPSPTARPQAVKGGVQ